MPYSLTFELYGSNQEGHRPDTWRLPTTPEQAFTDSEAPALAHRRALAAAQPVPCLAMFNPDTQGVYRQVVAG